MRDGRAGSATMPHDTLSASRPRAIQKEGQALKSKQPQPNSTRSHAPRVRLAAAIIGCALLFGAPVQASDVSDLEIVNASATTSADHGSSLAQKVRAAYWRGRTCTTPACTSGRPSGLADVASFGLAAVGGVWFSRRRSG